MLIVNVKEKETLAIIQTYAPTSAASDDEMNKYYDDLQRAQTEFQTESSRWVTLTAKLVKGIMEKTL